MSLPFNCPLCDTPGCYWYPNSGTVCNNSNCVHGLALAAEYKAMDEEAEKKRLGEIWNADNLGLGDPLDCNCIGWHTCHCKGPHKTVDDLHAGMFSSGLDCDCMSPIGWDCTKQGCHIREHGIGSGLDCSCGYPLCCCKGCFP